jgi:CubicO group peptidase (beta-lactamase class C family)
LFGKRIAFFRAGYQCAGFCGSVAGFGPPTFDLGHGHNWFIDPANHLTVVAMTNTALEGMWGRFKRDVRNAVYADLGRRAG